MSEVLEQKAPGVATCCAETLDHLSIDIEILALPLLDYYGNVTRIIGSVQMLSEPDILGYRKIVSQRISSAQLFGGSDANIDEDFDRNRPPRVEKAHLRLVSTRSDN